MTRPLGQILYYSLTSLLTSFPHRSLSTSNFKRNRYDISSKTRALFIPHHNPLTYPRHRHFSTSTEDLEWSKFEFSDNPKQDSRFESTSHIIQHTKNFPEVRKSEAALDELASQNLKESNAAISSLSPSTISRATSIIEPYITKERQERLDAVLSHRTTSCRFLFENPSNPSNVWACLRTVDSFGIQNVDLVVDSGKYTKKAAVAQKRGMRTAMGSARWVTLHSHPNVHDAVAELRKEGYKIYASDLNPNAVDIRDIEWKEGEKICVVMGNEDLGISDEMRELADETFTLPMVGFAESFNLSVATAITCAHLNAVKGASVIRNGDLDEHERACLKLRWYLHSIAQKKVGRLLLKKEGIELPDSFYQL